MFIPFRSLFWSHFLTSAKMTKTFFCDDRTTRWKVFASPKTHIFNVPSIEFPCFFAPVSQDAFRVLFWRRWVRFGAISDTGRIPKSTAELPKDANGFKNAPGIRGKAHSILAVFYFSCFLHKKSAPGPSNVQTNIPKSILGKSEIALKGHQCHDEKLMFSLKFQRLQIDP